MVPIQVPIIQEFFERISDPQPKVPGTWEVPGTLKGAPALFLRSIIHPHRACYGSCWTTLANSSRVKALIVVVRTLPAMPTLSNCARATSSLGASPIIT